MQFGKLSNKAGRDLYRLYTATGNGILTARREVGLPLEILLINLTENVK